MYDALWQCYHHITNTLIEPLQDLALTLNIHTQVHNYMSIFGVKYYTVGKAMLFLFPEHGPAVVNTEKQRRPYKVEI